MGKQLEDEIKRNNELQAIIDQYKTKENEIKNNKEEQEETENNDQNKSEPQSESALFAENESLKKKIEELTKETKKNNKLNMKLQILKQQVNKSQKQIKESNDDRNKLKLLWNEEITKLKEQNDFLVSSNHKDRAELKRMNEERKLLSLKFDLHRKQEQVYKKQIAEKENECNIIKKKQTENANQFNTAQQTNNTLKETTKKLYQQNLGLKADLKTRSDDYSDKTMKFQELNRKYQSMMDITIVF